LNWTTCKTDNFQFYKLVRSKTNSNPIYPNDPVIYSTANKNSSNTQNAIDRVFADNVSNEAFNQISFFNAEVI
jgi:hypothetical protein